MTAIPQGVVVSVDRGVHRLGIELRNHPFGGRPCCLKGKAVSLVALGEWPVAPAQSETRRMCLRSLCGTWEVPVVCSGGRIAASVGEGLWPNDLRVRGWEVG